MSDSLFSITYLCLYPLFLSLISFLYILLLYLYLFLLFLFFISFLYFFSLFLFFISFLFFSFSQGSIADELLRNSSVKEMYYRSQAKCGKKSPYSYKTSRKKGCQSTESVGKHSAGKIMLFRFIPKSQRKIVIRSNSKICRLVQGYP